MWFGEPHPFPERGSPTRLSTSGLKSYTGWSCRTPSCKTAPWCLNTSRKLQQNERRGRLISITASYVECPRFKSLPVHGYAIVVLFSPFWYSPRYFLKLGHDHFISHPFECTIFCFFPVWLSLPTNCEVQKVTDATEKKKHAHAHSHTHTHTHTRARAHTHTHTHTHGKTPVDEGSARRRDLNIALTRDR